MKPTGKYTKEAFEQHDQDNPKIWEYFKRFALEATKVRDHFSAKAIFHRIRWETMISETDGDFKVSDGWISHYARKFMREYPEHSGFFKTTSRKVTYHDS